MTEKEKFATTINIEVLKDGESYIVPEGDYGKAEIWYKNEYYFLFSIPNFGGNPAYEDAFPKHRVDDLVNSIASWT